MQLQKYKYTNTAHNEVPERPNMWHIFEMRIVQGYQKLYFHESNTKIQIQNTKIHNYNTWQIARKNMWHIFELRIVEGYQK